MTMPIRKPPTELLWNYTRGIYGLWRRFDRLGVFVGYRVAWRPRTSFFRVWFERDWRTANNQRVLCYTLHIHTRLWSRLKSKNLMEAEARFREDFYREVNGEA